MESNIKGLVSAGHEMASELKAECGAVDMRSVAKLISDLATQLEVQLVRANAMAAENAGLKAAFNPEEIPEDAVEAFTETAIMDHDCDDTGSWSWVENDTDVIRAVLAVIAAPETPATDAFLAEIERKAIRKFINSIEHILRDKLSPYDTEEMLEAMRIFLEEQGGEQK